MYYVLGKKSDEYNTTEICKKNNYNLIDLPVNLGLAGAFQTGMKYAF